jgi:hypothetical protein
MKNSIWTVSTLQIINPEMGKFNYDKIRCWGYYFSYEEAYKDMKRCVDTEAGYYTHVVIENFLPGIYAQCIKEKWFKWDNEKWKVCKKPESEINIINFGIG